MLSLRLGKLDLHLWRLIYDDKDALDKLDEALRNPHGTNQYVSKDLYNVQDRKAPSGNSIEAALRRLRADKRPIAKELHAKVLSHKLTPPLCSELRCRRARFNTPKISPPNNFWKPDDIYGPRVAAN